MLDNSSIATIIVAVLGSGVISVIINNIMNSDIKKANISKINAEIEKIKIDAQRDLAQILISERKEAENKLEGLKEKTNQLKLKNEDLAKNVKKLKEELEIKQEELNKTKNDLDSKVNILESK